MSHRVVAAILYRGQDVLLCHRSAERQWYPDVWDLPGGHVDDGESPTEALARELGEELSITVEALPSEPDFGWSDDDVSISVWTVEDWVGEPVNAAPDEHDEIGWFTGPELATLNLADRRIVAICLDALGRGRT